LSSAVPEHETQLSIDFLFAGIAGVAAVVVDAAGRLLAGVAAVVVNAPPPGVAAAVGGLAAAVGAVTEDADAVPVAATLLGETLRVIVPVTAAAALEAVASGAVGEAPVAPLADPHPVTPKDSASGSAVALQYRSITADNRWIECL
jgi:Zn-dependent M28 family amino/carboxypeptidase